MDASGAGSEGLHVVHHIKIFKKYAVKSNAANVDFIDFFALNIYDGWLFCLTH
jgi:hypothetical protein